MANVRSADMIEDKSDDALMRKALVEVDCIVSHVWPEMYDNQPRNLRLVGDFVKRIRDLSTGRTGGELSIWPDINPHAWRDSQRRDFAEPSPAELRFQVWLALISGADGVCFFTISFDPFVYLQIPSRNESEMIWNMRLINRLTPILTAAPSPLKISAAAEDEKAIIDITTRRHEGADYVFLLNGQNSEQTVTLTLDGLGQKYRMEIGRAHV